MQHASTSSPHLFTHHRSTFFLYATMEPLGMLNKEKRTKLAVVAYRRALENFEKQPHPRVEKPSIRKIARQYRLVDSTLRRRIGGARSDRYSRSQRTKLHPKQEEALARWILQMGAWGWRPRSSHIRFMATELLRKNESEDKLGKNWVQTFLSRHPELASMFSQPRDKEYPLRYDEGKLTSWFQLYLEVLEQYGFQPEDVWNVEEKGFAMAAQGELRVICSEYVQRGEKEWVSLIECGCAGGEVFKSWFIFGGKVHQDAWMTDILK